MRSVTNSKRNFAILLPAIIGLLAAMWAGLMRMGWSLPALQSALPIAHGPLMVSGFLGTLIGLERAVALSVTIKRPWLYFGPMVSAVGSILLTIGVRGPLAPLCLTLGSVALVGIFAAMYRRHQALFVAVMLAGSLAWFVGNVLWLSGLSIPHVVWWWAGFLVLTIAGERLELARLTQLSRFRISLFMATSGIYVTGLILATLDLDLGVRLSGAGVGLLALWFLQNDIARRTIRKADQVRFTAVCLLSGYVWLVVAALLMIAYGGLTAGARYDAMLHALFLGFVFAMIFGHAPIIFPAILGRPIAFSRVFYLPLGLLHVSLLLRVAGDLTGWHTGRQWGGLLNVLVLLMFLANTLRGALQTNTRTRTSDHGGRESAAG